MSTNLTHGPSTAASDLPLTAELSIEEHRYRILLPYAATDYIQKKLATDRTPYEQEMLEDIRDRVSPGSLVLDIGANIGNHTLYLAAVAGCRVESFEPNPELCAALRESIALNDLSDRVHLHETGLGRAAGTARFGVNTPNNLGAQYLTLGEGDLRVSALDSFAFGHPVEVIKLDVEGMEIDVLEGGRRLLARDRPLVYVECATEAHYRRIARWMVALNYIYWDTFNATPTHLFIPAERLGVDQRLQQLQAKSAQNDYKSNQLLRVIRLHASQAQEKEREASSRVSEITARLHTSEQQHAAEQRRLGEQVATLQAHLQTSEQQHAAEQRRLGEQVATLQAHLQAAKAASTSLQNRFDHAQHELDQSKLAIQRLNRTVEVREVRLAATERREAALAERLLRTRETTAFQIGQALVAAGRSFGGMVRLPLNLLRVYRGVLVRRQRRTSGGAQPTSDERMAQPTSDVVKRSSVAPVASVKVKPAASNPAKVIALPASLPHPASLLRLPTTLKGLRMAAIMDEFTYHSFQPECELLSLRIASWREQLESFTPDLVFIESAWKGAEGDWSLKISNPSEELAGVIGWAQARRVPTVFWNKEDPVHFGGFLHVARSVDYVFTTDIDCIARYKREVGHDRVYLLPFAVQPAAHNPIERFPREDAFCFAGSYYLKYPERQRNFRSLIDTVKELRPVEIFDRNFDKLHAHYAFPLEYQPYIKGGLPFDQIDKAYKGYRYGLNMNTIKQSQTMFARRVFELLASNTVVVSNFSRGVRLLFGDLVVCSDAADELRRRLEGLRDDLAWRKFRLAGLRKVMREHTYAHRLVYIVGKLGGCNVEETRGGGVCAMGYPRNAVEAEALLRSWRRQSLRNTHLCLVGPGAPAALTGEGVTVLPDAASLAAAAPYAQARWIAPLSAADHHGPHYLEDLLLATRFGRPSGVGKAAHYRCAAGAETPELVDGALAYRPIAQLPARASLLDRAAFEALQIADADALERASWRGDGLIAVDEFNYLRDAGPAPTAAAVAIVSDLTDLRTGIDTARDLIPLAERIAAAAHEDAHLGNDRAPGLSPQQMAELLPRSARAQMLDGRLCLRGPGEADKHRYLYLGRVFPRDELNLETNSRYQLIASRDDALDVRTVFEFLDENQGKISHAMMKIGAAHSMAIPARCQYVRFGLRLQGSGEVRIDRLVLADLRERPSSLVPTGACLLVAKQYPAYDDLYRYGFVHSRVRAYRAAGTTVDVLRLNNDETCSFREFEGTDVTHGDRDLLDLALRDGHYRDVLVHLLDAAMWETLERHLDRIRLTVWVHGAEIQTWERRAFEFEGLDEAEVARRKTLSAQRAEFWRRILANPHPNLRLVFVSRYVALEAVRDLGVDLSRVEHHVIPNFIDGALFPYRAKDAAMRHRILSVRPYASRAYGNDLMVEAIHQLARRPVFRELSFRIIGDGELFESITSSLSVYPNVNVERRFLPQAEIARLHADYGVFLCPSRMDTQGVSRDEAMASGLVPVTNRVAAVPEFTDDGCAMLAEPESAEQLAAAIEALHADPQRFQALSAAAARRVRSDRDAEQTIHRELALLASA